MSSQDDVVSSSQEDAPSPIMSQETLQQIEGELPTHYQDIIVENRNQEYSSSQYTLLASQGKTYHQLESSQSTSLHNQASSSQLTNLRNPSSQQHTFIAGKGKNIQNFSQIESSTTQMVLKCTEEISSQLKSMRNPSSHQHTVIAGNGKNIQNLSRIKLSSTTQLLPQIVGKCTEEISYTVPEEASLEVPYHFDIWFADNDQPTKSTPWTYSKMLNKLFVSVNLPCPVKFHIYPEPPQNSFIRATPYFRDPVHANDIPLRCLNHQSDKEPSNHGFIEVTHILRCDAPNSIYKEDRSTGRLSVLVPYRKPDPLITFSTFNYIFTCFTSCMGGMNRRAIDVAFTLESKDGILGQRLVEVRICACPGRDRMKCENKATKKVIEKSTVNEGQVSSSTNDSVALNRNRVPSQKLERQPVSDEPDRKRQRINCVTPDELFTCSVSFQVKGEEAASCLQSALDSLKMFATLIQERNTPTQAQIPEVLLSDEELKKESQD